MARGKAVSIDLMATERAELEALVRRHGTAQGLALRARIVLLAAEGLTNSAIAEALRIAQHTAGKWRALAGLGTGAPTPVRLARALRRRASTACTTSRGRGRRGRN